MGMQVSKIDKIRIGVGEEGKPHSSLWVAWANGSDFYFGSRPIAGFLKVSLHASRACHVAITDRHWSTLQKQGLELPPNRQFTEWERKPTPPTGAIHVASIFFSTDFSLVHKERPKLSKPVCYIKPAPPGKAVEIGFFYSLEGPETLEQKFQRIGLPMFNSKLANDEIVSVVARLSNFESSAIPYTQSWTGPVTPLSNELSEIEQGEKLENLSAVMWNDPNKDGPLQIVEVSGLTIHRN